MKLDAVVAFLAGLPDVAVGTKWGMRTWMVGDKGFAWERPFRKSDLARFGDEPPPAGDILAIKVADLDAKDALLAIAPRGFFTIPHFNGYPAVLVALRAARTADVRAALLDAHRLASERTKPARKPPARRTTRAPRR